MEPQQKLVVSHHRIREEDSDEYFAVLITRFEDDVTNPIMIINPEEGLSYDQSLAITDNVARLLLNLGFQVFCPDRKTEFVLSQEGKIEVISNPNSNVKKEVVFTPEVLSDSGFSKDILH